MNLDLTAEQAAIRETVRDFARERVAPRAEEMDREEAFPYDLVREMAGLGLMGLPFPEEYGGSGADTVSYALAVMELARADASTAITMAAHVSLGAMPFYLFGTDEQKERYLTPLAQGKQLWGFGLTEPNAGSDAGNVQTKGVLRDGKWIVNGTKAFITNSGTDITAGTTITGRNRKTRRRKAGDQQPDRAARCARFCAQQEIPQDGLARFGYARALVCGLRDSGGKYSGRARRRPQEFSDDPRRGRISVAALSVGLARGAYDESMKYAKERHAFGKPIGKFQAIAFKLVDMITEIEHAELMVLKAAWEKDQGRDFVKSASFAKLYAAEVSHRVVNQAVQIHGGYGFMDEYPVSRMYRDQKINEIGEGTNEIQRIVLAKLIGL